MSLIQHTDGVWSFKHHLRVGGLIPLGTRTTIVRIDDGALLLHSPGPLSDAQHSQIQQLGTVSTIVSPNLEHTLFLDAAAQRYPEAQLWTAPGCSTALPRAAQTLDNIVDPPWKNTLRAFAVDGMPKLMETVFLHVVSKTLIITDLSFNIRDAGFWDRMLLGLTGAHGKFGPSRLLRSYYLQEADALRRSLDIILEQDFDRVIPAHGEVVEAGAHEGLRQAFAFLKPAHASVA